MFTFFTAFRFIKNYILSSGPKIAIATVLITSLAVSIPIVTTGLVNGFHKAIIEKHIDKDFHIRLIPNWHRYFSLYPSADSKAIPVNEIISRLSRMKGIKYAIPMYTGKGLLRHGDRYTGVVVRGLPPSILDYDPSFRHNFSAVKGKMHLSPFKIAIGTSLATKLDVNPGDIVSLVIATEKDFIPVILKVEAIFSTGYMQYDKNIIFLSLNTLLQLLPPTDVVTSIAVKLVNTSLTYQVDEQINKAIDYPIYTVTWLELNRNLFFAFKWEKNIVTVVVSILMITIMIAIYINVNILVVDKGVDIAVMKSYGVSGRQVRKIFVIEGVLLGIIGVFVGLIIAYLVISNVVSIADFLNKFFKGAAQLSVIERGRIPVDLGLADLVFIISLSLVASFLGALIPARRAAKLRPVSILRYE